MDRSDFPLGNGASQVSSQMPFSYLSVEGLITISFSAVAIFILPDFPGNTKWLSEEERRYAVARLVADNNIDSSEDAAIGYWRSFVLAAKDWKTWLFCFGQSTLTAAGTITYFVPTLMNALGYTGTRAQFVSTPPVALTTDDGPHLYVSTSLFSDP